MRTFARNPYVGILVTERMGEPPFACGRFYRQLCEAGRKLGLNVFVFSPQRIDWAQSSVTGYDGSDPNVPWVRRTFPLPDVIYDRCFFQNRHQADLYRETVRRLREKRDIRFLGYGLRGKWEVQLLLQRDPVLAPCLPETARLRSLKAARKWLEHKGEAFFKPENGSQGKGALYVKASSGSNEAVFVSGRDRRNRRISYEFAGMLPFLRWLRHFIGTRPYLIQSYLQLTTSDGNAYDIRTLMQKNDKGLWGVTGMAVRLGEKGSVTSNLHGGGSALEVAPFLEKQFGRETALELVRKLTDLAERIPDLLEQHHGRLAELGVDLGVDRNGRVWVLEVNSKPGRNVFAQLKHNGVRKAAVENPLRYARYLLACQSLQRKLS